MSRHYAIWAIAALAAWAAPSNVDAADKASAACIQAADEGQTARDDGQLLRARELFAQCSESKCPSVIRRDCASWIEQVKAQIPSVVLGARDAQGHDVVDPRVTIDGHPLEEKARGVPIELDPGPHVIRWESAGAPPAELRIFLRAQEKNRDVVATFARSTPTATAPAASPVGEKTGSGGLPPATYVLGGIGAAALGTFAYFGLRARHDSDVLHDTCAPACPHDDVAALKTKVLIADVALGVATISVAAAAVVAWTASSRTSKTAWEVRVTPGLAGARADLQVRF
jgi:hypothetical protein